MKFRKLNLPPNYYINEERQGTLSRAEKINIYDAEIPNTSNRKLYPHKQVARVSSVPKYMLGNETVACMRYWDTENIQGDRLHFPDLEAAMCHVEAMAGMGLLGHGYKKGMLNEQ
jgi:hypothetical protein